MIYSSIAINLLFFTTGYCANTLLLNENKYVRNILFSLPTGFAIFSLFWLTVNTTFSSMSDYEINFFYTYISMILCLILVVAAVIHKKSHYKKLKNIRIISYILINVTLLTIAFYYFRTTILFGDSYNIITLSNTPSYILSRGFSAFGLPHSNLSAFFHADFYNYSLHPLLTVNLVFLIVYMTVTHENKTESIITRSVLSTSLILLFISNNNFVWQSFYINLHVFTAVFILMVSSIIKDNSKSSSLVNFYIIFCLVVISLTRMEGIMTSFFIIIFYFFNEKVNFNTRKIIFGSFLLFSSIYIAILSFILADNKSYSPQRYILFFIIMLVAYLVDLMFIRKNKIIIRHFSRLVVLTAFTALLLLIVLNKELTKSLVIFASNSFEEIFWGLTNHAFVILFAIILFNRIKTRRNNEDHDSYIYLFIFCVFVIMILANFHPYRKGWFDSANRMLFHFMPLMVVWIGIEIKKLVFYRKS
jgi:hypothetical protein